MNPHPTANRGPTQDLTLKSRQTGDRRTEDRTQTAAVEKRNHLAICDGEKKRNRKMAANSKMTPANVVALVVVVVAVIMKSQTLFHHLATNYYHPLIGLTPFVIPEDKYGFDLNQLQSVDLRGQVALVTGANSGIGFELSKMLASHGADVTMACRNPQRCFAAADRIRKEVPSASVSPLILDLSSLSKTSSASRTFLMNHERLDLLFLNAGIASPFELSVDGIEHVFQVNVVSHHLLYRILEPLLQMSEHARVVSTSSVAGKVWVPYGSVESFVPPTIEGLNGWNPTGMRMAEPFFLYGRSKLAQILWTKKLTRRLGNDSTIHVNAFHPGAVYTAIITKGIPKWVPEIVQRATMQLLEQLLWSPTLGALTGLYLATQEVADKNIRGAYFHPQTIEVVNPYSLDETAQDNVWELCEVAVKKILAQKMEL